MAAPATTAAAHAATAGARTMARTVTRSSRTWRDGRSSRANAIAPTAAITATVTNGSRIPPNSYSQPPSDGPIMNPNPVPDMTIPVARPRSAGS